MNSTADRNNQTEKALRISIVDCGVCA